MDKIMTLAKLIQQYDDSTLTNADAFKLIERLLSEKNRLDDISEKYNELIMTVENKSEVFTKHEVALNLLKLTNGYVRDFIKT